MHLLYIWRMKFCVLYGLLSNFMKCCNFCDLRAYFTKWEISCNIVWLSYQNPKYRVISCGPKKKISLMGGGYSWARTPISILSAIAPSTASAVSAHQQHQQHLCIRASVHQQHKQHQHISSISASEHQCISSISSLSSISSISASAASVYQQHQHISTLAASAHQ